MRQTEYTRGFMTNLDIDNANGEMTTEQVLNHMQGGIKGSNGDQGPNAKVFRSWSRPQINSELPEMQVSEAHAGLNSSSGANANGKVFKTMQVCTCAKFRKSVERSRR